jgi:hypothetical protein
MQLVAYGAQDIYLTGNPQITFFKVVYRRHTNFSMESIEQTFNGSADFGKKVTCTISRNGDLIHRVYLQVTLPRVELDSSADQFRWLNWIGHVLIKSVEVEIGGQRIDKHYGDWMHIWNELTQESGHQAGYANMVGNVARLTQVTSGATVASGGQTCLQPPQGYDNCDVCGCIPETTIYIPLQFWFCRNPGLALPLIALQYHEVKINLEFRDAAQCYWSSSSSKYNCCAPSLRSASLFVDYIYLDTDERRRFAHVSHEYLIEQLQFTGDESVNSTSNKIKLNFNHPVKELVWVVQPDSNVDLVTTNAFAGPQWFNYTDAIDVSYFSGTPDDPLGAAINLGLSNMAPPVGGWALGTGGVSGPQYLGSVNPTTVNNPVPNVGSQLDDLTGVGSASVSGQVNQGVQNFVQNLAERPNIGGGINNWEALTNAAGTGLFDRGLNPVVSAKLQLNGHDRFSEREGRYFNLVQPYQHHTNIPATGINVYSFGLKPEEHQPSGTCNMSRIDNATLQLTLTPDAVNHGRSCKVRVYATNYNVLRIMSGMGGLAYSN